jgi:signal transduction histidine kinase
MRKPTTIPSKKKYSLKVAFDIALVLSVFAYAYFASSYFNFSDQYFDWAQKYEDSLDIDELPIALLASTIALLWFAKRRIHETNTLINNNHALLKRVIEIQEEERKRIAQDLHDDMGQYLNAVKVQATSLLLEKAGSDSHSIIVQRIVETTDHAYQSARNLMYALRPVALDELGLSAALEHLVQSWQTSINNGSISEKTVYKINFLGEINQLGETMNIAIFRIVQEALTNIAKHAKAKNVLIVMQNHSHQLELRIIDDGIGFNTKQKSKGYGLLGMIERAESLNGKLNVLSSKNGTTILLTLPLQQI